MNRSAEATRGISGFSRVEDGVILVHFCLLPLFWVSIISVAGFSIDLSLIGLVVLGVLGFYKSGMIKSIVEYKELIVYSVVFIFLYLIYSIFWLELRSSLILSLVQIVMILLFCGVGFLIWEMLCQGRKNIVAASLLSSLIVFFVVFLFSGDWHLSDFFEGLLFLDSQKVVRVARDAFGYSLIEAGLSYSDFINLHNKVAQHVFGYSYFVFCVSIFLKKRVVSSICIIISFLLAFFGVLILSGQVLAELILTIFLLVVFFVINRRLGISVIFVLSVFVAFISLVLVSDSEFFVAWQDRLSGDDLSTGRLDIWQGYYEELTFGSFFIGLRDSAVHDTHSFWVLLVADFGVWFSLLAFGLFLKLCWMALLKALFVKDYVLFSALSLSVLLHIFVSLSIGGGYGMPGFSEYYKIPLLVILLKLASDQRRKLYE